MTSQIKRLSKLDVPPHPHIGLLTLIYLFEGAIMHRDSLGTELEIQPRAINWRTAEKGVVHSERTPKYLRTMDKNLHGLQIWVDLPKNLENCVPSFTHIEVKNIPYWEQDNGYIKLISGTALEENLLYPLTVDFH